MKFAVEVARTMLLATNYVVEADNEDEARREVEGMFNDPEFADRFEDIACIVDDESELMIADCFEVDDDLETDIFFNE